MNNADRKKAADSNPANDASEPMNTKQDVAQSPDERTDQDFPGFPHHPSRESDMGKDTSKKDTDLKVEEDAADNNSGVGQRFGSENEQEDKGERKNASHDDAKEIEHLEALDSKEKEIGTPQNITNQQLEKEGKLPGGHQPGT